LFEVKGGREAEACGHQESLSYGELRVKDVLLADIGLRVFTRGGGGRRRRKGGMRHELAVHVEATMEG